MQISIPNIPSSKNIAGSKTAKWLHRQVYVKGEPAGDILATSIWVKRALDQNLLKHVATSTFSLVFSHLDTCILHKIHWLRNVILSAVTPHLTAQQNMVNTQNISWDASQQSTFIWNMLQQCFEKTAYIMNQGWTIWGRLEDRKQCYFQTWNLALT